MKNLFSGTGRSLPETLLDDLEELLTWDNNCYLRWVWAGNDTEAEGSRWFSVALSSDGREFGLRLQFWIPDWMTERGVSAILPASLSPADFHDGRWAAVDLGMRRWSEVEASLPKVARTSARLINELWGRTESEDVLLLTIEYQDEQLETGFAEVPDYGQ